MLQNFDRCLISFPFQIKIKGITDISALSPPSRLQAPGTPRSINIGVVARGRTVARRLREQLDAAFADAA